MKEVIENQLWAFGFLPLLSVLEILEREEDFETCNLILQVLDEHSQRLGIEIPTKYSDDAIAEMKIAFMAAFGLSGDVAFSNNWYYAEKNMEAINTKKRLMHERQVGK